LRSEKEKAQQETASGCAGVAVSWHLAAMMARNVRRHRPQSAPAPHDAAICFDVVAPFATASSMCSRVAPVHRHTNIPTATFWETTRCGRGIATEVGLT
jgi:hypothetical protein